MKYDILKQLKTTTEFVSGESLSAGFGVTRAALWKHIKTLQADGAVIESVPHKGYRLISPPGIPRADYVKAYLDTEVPVFYSASVPSTNDSAKQTAINESFDRAVFIAGEQTAGKGRKGRTWVSPMGKGLYMSFLIHPQIDPARISGLTLMAAVAVCRAIEATTGISPSIKWPNDILIEGKKVAGILTESLLGMDGIEYVVCGIGVNLLQKRFADDLRETACSLSMHTKEMNPTLLAASVIDCFFDAYDIFVSEGLSELIPEFKKRNALQGEITVSWPGGSETGLFTGFDNAGAILINSRGIIKRFVAGEVSLRGDHGYV